MPPQLPPGTCPSRDKELIPFSCSLLCGSAFPGTTRPPCLGKQGGRKTSQSHTLGFQRSSALCLGVFLEPRRPHLELELTIIPPWEGCRHQTRPHTESTSMVPECPHWALEGRDGQSRAEPAALRPWTPPAVLFLLPWPPSLESQRCWWGREQPPVSRPSPPVPLLSKR